MGQEMTKYHNNVKIYHHLLCVTLTPEQFIIILTKEFSSSIKKTNKKKNNREDRRVSFSIHITFGPKYLTSIGEMVLLCCVEA